MIKINLLPFEKKEAEKVTKKNLGMFIVCLTVFIILAIIIVVLISVNYTIKTNLSGTNNNIEFGKNSLKVYADVKDESLFIKDRLSELNNLGSKKTIWSNPLLDLANATPASVQLTGFSIDPTKTPSITINGLCANKDDIITFKEQLDSTASFKDTIFQSAQEVTLNEKQYFTFILTGSLEQK